jgi:hypothetical protein
MIGVALAFLAPWIIVRAAFIGVVRAESVALGRIASSDAARPTGPATAATAVEAAVSAA